MDVNSECNDRIDSPNEVGSVLPMIKIIFRDEKVEKTFQSSIIKFFTQRNQPCIVIPNSSDNLELHIFEKDTDEDVLDFTVDNTPEHNSRSCSSRVPYYGKTHDVILSDQSSLKTESNKSSPNSFSSCFNCMGNHTLRDCPMPRDGRVISRNRLKFQSTNKPTKSSRYHLDENQKFGSLVPGNVSKKLRHALNLHRDEQPGFIYRMRLLGYPPAWLEEAKVSHSGVAMYDSIGVPVLEEDEEEGEIIPDGAKDRYDTSKIIEFPGFNVPLPKNTKDEYKMHHCPPISEEYSKETLIKQLQPNAVQAYKKRSLTVRKSSPSREEPTVDQISKDLANKQPVSPSIEEMEEKKKQLLMALVDDDDGASGGGGDDTPAPKFSESEACSSKEIEVQPMPQTPVKQLGCVKNLDFGTPILTSVSPFSKLPSREQFSVNVSDVINFENLPNSTGKYETMSNLIMKIRGSRKNESS